MWKNISTSEATTPPKIKGMIDLSVFIAHSRYVCIWDDSILMVVDMSGALKLSHIDSFIIAHRGKKVNSFNTFALMLQTGVEMDFRCSFMPLLLAF